MALLKVLLLKRSILFPKEERVWFIYRSAPACNIVFGKMSGSHELKKVVIWEIHLLIELASRKTWESKRVLWWELGLLRGSELCKEKIPVLRYSGFYCYWESCLTSSGLSFLSCAWHTFNAHARAWGPVKIQVWGGPEILHFSQASG